jgi:hypothetical protein
MVVEREPALGQRTLASPHQRPAQPKWSSPAHARLPEAGRAAPRRRLAPAAQPAAMTTTGTRRLGLGQGQGQETPTAPTTTARAGLQAPPSWERPKWMGRPARSTMAPVESGAARSLAAIPSRCSQDRASPVRVPVQLPTKAEAAGRMEAPSHLQRVPTRRAVIPKSARAAPRREAVAGRGLALWARRARALPTLARAGRPEPAAQPALRALPKWAPPRGVPAVEVGPQPGPEPALERVRPKFGRPAGQIQQVQREPHPTSVQQGPSAAWPAWAPLPTGEAAQPTAVRAQPLAPTATPRLARLPAPATTPPDPSWAMRRGEPPQSEPPGLAHALRPAGPMWWQFQQEVETGSTPTAEPGTTDVPAAPPSCACVAGA